MPQYYTRTGDKGETGLFGGQRTPKDSPRIAAYGTVDELNSFVGLARSFVQEKSIDAILKKVQEDLFVVGADLATPENSTAAKAIKRVDDEMVKWLEQNIDEIAKKLRPMKRFILPTGVARGAVLQVARVVARRAERKVVEASRKEKINPQITIYLNRLSSLLFVLAREVNRKAGATEEEWAGSQK